MRVQGLRKKQDHLKAVCERHQRIAGQPEVIWTRQDQEFSQFCEHDVRLALDDLERRLQDLSRDNTNVQLAVDPLPVTKALRKDVDELTQGHDHVHQIIMDLKNPSRPDSTGM